MSMQTRGAQGAPKLPTVAPTTVPAESKAQEAKGAVVVADSFDVKSPAQQTGLPTQNELPRNGAARASSTGSRWPVIAGFGAAAAAAIIGCAMLMTPANPGASTETVPTEPTEVVASHELDPSEHAQPAPRVSYVVQAGESFESIADDHGLSYGELWSMNSKLLDPGKVKEGHKILVSGPMKNPVYNVQDGETLAELASRFDVSVKDLRTENVIDAPKDINAGDNIRIPFN